MQDLVGRLTALDPDASETLKVIAYFDTLNAGGAGLDGLLRGAAVLSGVVAGAERRGRTTRYSPRGLHVTDTEIHRSLQRTTRSGSVWLERVGPPHANDEMILERLGLAVDLAEARRNPEGALETALDAGTPVSERAKALARLRVRPNARIRLIATATDAPVMSAPSTVMPTRFGILRATLDLTGELAPTEPAGIGPRLNAERAPESWEGAVIAYRLTDPKSPVVDATDIGALLILAQAYDPREPHDDVRALAALDPRSADIARVLVESDSVRSAAARLGMHHSTMQAKHESLTRALGYDPRTITGHARYIAAALLLRLSDPF
ncbi:hypothetical protein ACIBG7_27565 [Nonomuraea sp. NPDC050328]|uniref:hypothetical protein n=1 Tax=Nonomuraea sp. NPDC050328 TaxID=3364361 RepID=UPI0037B0D57E